MENEKKEILELADVKKLVNAFYGKVREDEVLKDIFNDIIQDRWPEHLEKMYRFWQTILLQQHTYLGSPFLPHARLPIERQHFEQWMKLFTQTVDELFEGDKAEEAKWRAGKMAEMFLYKIEYYRNNPSKKVVG